jgi:hypothetical protein
MAETTRQQKGLYTVPTTPTTSPVLAGIPFALADRTAGRFGSADATIGTSKGVDHVSRLWVRKAE